MKKISRKLLCCFLALSMATSLVPFSLSAFAEGETASAEETTVTPAYGKTINYSELGKFVDGSGDGQEITPADFNTFGMVESSNMTVCDNYYLPEANWSTLNSWFDAEGKAAGSGGEFPKPYIVYRAKPNTAFEVSVSYDTAAKAKMEKALGEAYEIKLYVSRDSKNWTETGYIRSAAANTESVTRDEIVYTMQTVTATVLSTGDNGYFVKVEYPNNGAEQTYLNSVGNRNTAVKSVSFTADNSETYVPVDAGAASERSALLGVVEQSGTEFTKSGISATYAALAGKTDIDKPYIIFEAQTDAPFKLRATRSAGYEKRLVAGVDTETEKFMVKVYTSSDKSNWTEQTADFKKTVNKWQTRSNNTYATFDIFLSNGAKYVKVEFPQTGDMSIVYPNAGFGSLCGNDFIFLNVLDRVAAPTDSSSVVYDYAAGSDIRNQITDGSITTDNLSILGACDASPIKNAGWKQEAFGFEPAGIKTMEGYLYTNGNLPTYLTYNVEPGSAFSAELLIDAARKAEYETANNVTFEFKLQASADNSSWEDIASTGSASGAYVVLSASVPETASYVRIVFPQSVNKYNSNGYYYCACAILKSVTMTPPATYDVNYDYTDLETMPLAQSTGGNESNKRFIRTENDVKSLNAIDALLNNHEWNFTFERNKADSATPGAIRAGYSYLNTAGNETPWLTYDVSNTNYFNVRLYINTAIDSQDLSAYSDGKFSFKAYDAETGELLITSDDQRGEFVMEVPVGKTNKVKLVFPQIAQAGKPYNGMAELRGVFYNRVSQSGYAGKLKDSYTVGSAYGSGSESFVLGGSHSAAAAENTSRIIATYKNDGFNALVLSFAEAGKSFRVYASDSNEELFDRCVLEGTTVKGTQLYMMTVNVDGAYIGIEVDGTSAELLSAVKDHEILPGDLDGSGVLGAGDLVVMRKVLLGLEEIDLRIGDVDEKGVLDIRDLVHLKKALA